VDLEAFARATDGFTGADLQALVYNANLEAVHETIDQKSSNNISGKGKGSGILDESQKIRYITLSPEGSEKKVLSGAEEMAIQRQVRDLVYTLWSGPHLRHVLAEANIHVYLQTSRRGRKS
jgi:peroxin-1